jgi:hypothetical protein
MTDIAGIFHWPLSELKALDIKDLIFWRGRAIRWWNQVNTPSKGSGKGK